MGRTNRSKTREYGNPIPLTLRPNEVVTKRSHLEKEKEKRKDALLKAIGEFLNGEPNESDSTIMSALQRGLQTQDEVVPPHAPTPSHEEHLRLQQKVAEQEATIKDLRDVVDKMIGIIKRMENSPQCTLQPAVPSAQSDVAVAQFDNSMDQTRCTERHQPAESRSHIAGSTKESGGERRIDLQPIQLISIKREVEESEQEMGAHPSVECVPNAVVPTRKRRKSLDMQKEKERNVPSTVDDIKSQIGPKANRVATTPRPAAGGSLGWLADAYASPRTPRNKTQSVTVEEDVDDFHSRVSKLSLKQGERIANKINEFRVQNRQSGYTSMEVTNLSVNQQNAVQNMLYMLASENEEREKRLEAQKKVREQAKSVANPHMVAELDIVRSEGSLGWPANASASPRTPRNKPLSGVCSPVTIEEDDFHSRVSKLSLKQGERIAKKINGFRVHNGQSGYSALDLTDLSVYQRNSVESRLCTKERRQEAHKRRKARKQEKTIASSNAVAEVVNATSEVTLDKEDFDARVRTLPERRRKKIATLINVFQVHNGQTWKPQLTENSVMDVADLSEKQWIAVRNELTCYENKMMEKAWGKSIETSKKFPEKAVKNSSILLDETSATYDASISDVDVVIFPADHRRRIVQMINLYRKQNNQTAWKPVMGESDYSVDISDLSVAQLSAVRKLVRELIGVNGFSITYIKQFFPCLLNF